jgi:hypothetical protein
MVDRIGRIVEVSWRCSQASDAEERYATARILIRMPAKGDEQAIDCRFAGFEFTDYPATFVDGHNGVDHLDRSVVVRERDALDAVEWDFVPAIRIERVNHDRGIGVTGCAITMAQHL